MYRVLVPKTYYLYSSLPTLALSPKLGLINTCTKKPRRIVEKAEKKGHSPVHVNTTPPACGGRLLVEALGGYATAGCHCSLLAVIQPVTVAPRAAGCLPPSCVAEGHEPSHGQRPKRVAAASQTRMAGAAPPRLAAVARGETGVVSPAIAVAESAALLSATVPCRARSLCPSARMPTRAGDSSSVARPKVSSATSSNGQRPTRAAAPTLTPMETMKTTLQQLEALLRTALPPVAFLTRST